MAKKFTSIEEVNTIIEDNIFKPKITVVGIGGAGTNAVNNMIEMDLKGVKFVVMNTDLQALDKSHCSLKLQIGPKVTQGLGAGSLPEIGIQSAEESTDDIKKLLEGSNMVFITCGMGGGTGTGASQVVAKIAKEMGILTIAFVTKPFNFEGSQRLDIALLGISELEKIVDSIIVISNQNLFQIIDANTTILDAFKVTDSILYSGVKGITDLVISSGLVNLDFNDIRSVIQNMGRTMIGAAEASGENRAEIVAKAAIYNPLLDDISLRGAKKALINITGGENITLFEIDEIINIIKLELNEEAFINFGTVNDNSIIGDTIRVSIIAAGLTIDENSNKKNEDMHNFSKSRSGVSAVNKKNENTDNIDTISKKDIQNYDQQIEDEIVNVTKQPNIVTSMSADISKSDDDIYHIEDNHNHFDQLQNSSSIKKDHYIEDESILENNSNNSKKEDNFLDINEDVDLFDLIARKKQSQNHKPESQISLNRDNSIKKRNSMHNQKAGKSSISDKEKDISFFDLPSFLKKKKD